MDESVARDLRRPGHRTIRYHEIADELRAAVAGFPPGRVLPSESELSARYRVSRVTVRKALETLRDEGLVESRQGFGWFVPSEPLAQRLNTLTTIEAQITERGRRAVRRILDFDTVTATGRVAEVLGQERVLRVRRLNLVDDIPLAVVTVWCPARLAAHLQRADVERRSFYELLGVTLRGATQTIIADAASASDAALLDVPLGSPVLHCERITTGTDGEPVLLSEHVFAGLRTRFVVDLPTAEPSEEPAGLRLAE